MGAVFHFATCDRHRALEFIRAVYPSKTISADDAGPLLDFIEKDIVRIQDPMMHGNSPQIIPGTNWDESHRQAVFDACLRFHK